MTAHDYYRDASPTGSTYEALQLEVTEACSRIDMIPCSEVSDTMLQIKDGLIADTAEGIEEAWQSDLSASFNSAIEKTKSAINNLIIATGWGWAMSENTYKELLEQLEELKQKNEEFKTFVENREPRLSDRKYCRTETITNDDGTTKRVTKQNETAYKHDHERWNTDVETLAQALETLQSSINEKVTSLQNANYSGESYYSSMGAGVVAGSLASDYTNMSNLVAINNALPQDMDLDWFQQFLGAVHEGRVSQAAFDYYWGGGKSKSTGCAGVAIMMSVYEAAKTQYGVDSVYAPIDEAWKYIYDTDGVPQSQRATRGGSSGIDWTYGKPSQAVKDVSAALNDFLFMEFDTPSGKSRIFTAENAKPMTDAGVGLAVSLAEVPAGSGGHWLSIHEINDQGQASTNDSGWPGNETIDFDTRTFRRRNAAGEITRTQGGYIGGQRGVATVPNAIVSTSGEVGTGSTVSFPFEVPDGLTSISIQGTSYKIEKVEGDTVTLGEKF